MDTGPAQRMRFTCFLLEPGVASSEAVLRKEFRPGGKQGMHLVEAADGVPNGTLAFLGSTVSGSPDWATKLSAAYPELATLSSKSHRFVLLLPVDDRVFAVTFGYGATTIRRAAIVGNFGLSYAARVLRTDGLREFGSRRMDASARTQSVQIYRDGGVNDLDVSPDGEFVHRLVGHIETAPGGLDAGGAIVAGDWLSFPAEVDLPELVAKLKEVLRVVSEKRVKREFEFVDALSPVAKNDERTPDFDRQLVNALNRSLNGLRHANGATVAPASPHACATSEPRSRTSITSTWSVPPAMKGLQGLKRAHSLKESRALAGNSRSICSTRSG